MSDSDWMRMRPDPRVWWLDAYGVFRFALSMWNKLRANRFKAHWLDNGDYYFFRARIEEELEELDLAGTYKERMDETADIGNFAMMIHEQARRRKLPAAPKENA